MKVYVITKGAYSDYSIYGVTLNKKQAETIRKYISDKYEEGMIEEYDTDDYKPLNEGKKAYEIHYNNGTRYCRLMTYDVYAFNAKVRKNMYGGYEVNVWAEDEEHALKIADDKLAEYKYRKAMKE